MSSVITAMVLSAPLYGVTALSGGGFGAAEGGLGQSLRNNTPAIFASGADRSGRGAADGATGQPAVLSSEAWVSPPASVFASSRGEQPGVIRRMLDRVTGLISPLGSGGSGASSDGPGPGGGQSCRVRVRS